MLEFTLISYTEVCVQWMLKKCASKPIKENSFTLVFIIVLTEGVLRLNYRKIPRRKLKTAITRISKESLNRLYRITHRSDFLSSF
jgi:hypothetical protein